MPIELLDSNHKDAIIDAFSKTKHRIRIISPFIQVSMTRHLASSTQSGIKSQLITRFYREDFIRVVISISQPHQGHREALHLKLPFSYVLLVGINLVQVHQY